MCLSIFPRWTWTLIHNVTLFVPSSSKFLCLQSSSSTSVRFRSFLRLSSIVFKLRSWLMISSQFFVFSLWSLLIQSSQCQKKLIFRGKWLFLQFILHCLICAYFVACNRILYCFYTLCICGPYYKHNLCGFYNMCICVVCNVHMLFL